MPAVIPQNAKELKSRLVQITHDFFHFIFTSPRFTSLRFTSPRFTNTSFTSPPFTSPRFNSPRFTNPRFTSPRFTSPVHSSPVHETQYATEKVRIGENTVPDTRRTRRVSWNMILPDLPVFGKNTGPYRGISGPRHVFFHRVHSS